MESQSNTSAERSGVNVILFKPRQPTTWQAGFELIEAWWRFVFSFWRL